MLMNVRHIVILVAFMLLAATQSAATHVLVKQVSVETVPPVEVSCLFSPGWPCLWHVVQQLLKIVNIPTSPVMLRRHISFRYIERLEGHQLSALGHSCVAMLVLNLDLYNRTFGQSEMFQFNIMDKHARLSLSGVTL